MYILKRFELQKHEMFDRMKKNQTLEICFYTIVKTYKYYIYTSQTEHF